MRIRRLELENFRNYSTAVLTFDGGINVICGKNGAGKTNILESVYMLSLSTSPRTTKDKETIKFGEKKARVKMVLEKKFRTHTVILQIEENSKKKVTVDGIPVSRAAELIGVLGVVFFSPDEMRLVKETPAERRRFLDVGLSQQQKSYFIALSRYNKVLKQKNNLLKNLAIGGDADGMLAVWDAQLADYGAVIVQKRKAYIEKLNREAAEAHRRLSGGKEELTLSYETPVFGESAEEMKKSLAEKLAASREKDKQLGFCSVGPHRDDIAITVNGLDARKFASQGQQRTIALAMKLGETALFTEESGETPVLLLDDVMSELDADRQQMLTELAGGVQTLVTCTEFSFPGRVDKVIRIADGKVEEK